MKTHVRHGDAQTANPMASVIGEVQSEKRVVIFRQGSIGDFVISLPCLYAIRKNYPDTQITLLTNVPTNQRAVPAMNVLDGTQLIDNYLSYSGGTRNYWELIKIRRALRKLNPQTLIYLAPPRGAFSIYRDLYFFRWCGIKNIIGLPTTRDLKKCRPPPLGSTVWESEASRLARSLQWPHRIAIEEAGNWDLHLSAAEIEAANRLLREGFSLDQFGKISLLGLSIGTKQKINDWGMRNWRAVVKGLNQPHLGLILIGAAEDRERSQTIANEWQGPALNLCGKISPRVSAAVLKNVALFLCHDSGPMHLAASVGTRCVAVFSRRNPPGKWYPFGKNHKIFYPPSATDTIMSIEPDQVIAATMGILGTLSGRPNLESDAVAASS